MPGRWLAWMPPHERDVLMNAQELATAIVVVGLGAGMACSCSVRVTSGGAIAVPPLRQTGATPPLVQRFHNCSQMYAEGWTQGVYWIGGSYRSDWNEAERATFGANAHLDHDQDWHACESNQPGLLRAITPRRRSVRPSEEAIHSSDQPLQRVGLRQ